MILEGKMDVLFGEEGVSFEIRDDRANVGFVRVSMTPEQWMQACSRLRHVDCILDVRNLDKVGKTHENKTFEFELPDQFKGLSSETEKLREYAQQQLQGGWIAEGYYGASNSFFIKDGKRYARCTIRRWI